MERLSFMKNILINIIRLLYEKMLYEREKSLKSSKTHQILANLEIEGEKS